MTAKSLMHHALSVFVWTLAGCGNVDPTIVPENTSLNYDSDPSSTGTDSTPNGEIPEDCSGECLIQAYTTCTCDPSDPCGWGNDGVCDEECTASSIVAVMFDDGEDCNDNCNSDCTFGYYSECTCDVSDPCGWAKDGQCDKGCVLVGVVTEMFDDAADCTGPCEGECDIGGLGVYTACTCGKPDPCGWREDGECDEGCLELPEVTEMFDDSEDCSNPAAAQ